MTRASIIIPVWNGLRFLGACLDAVLAQEAVGFEVIAVDNASVDGSADYILKHRPKARLIRNDTNLGFSGGCNVGINEALGDAIVLLNQDTRVQQGWLQAILGALETPDVGVVGCKILYPDEITIQHAGGRIAWPLGLAYHYGKGDPDLGQWDTERSVEYVTGAAMAFRRDTLARVGLLDEGFWPGYFEDLDFCLRAREAGYKVKYTPQAVLLHAETASQLDPMTLLSTYHTGRLRFVLKHTEPQSFVDDFAEAEEQYQSLVIQRQKGQSLRAAYQAALSAAPDILELRWRATQTVIDEVLDTLKILYHEALEKEHSS